DGAEWYFERLSAAALAEYRTALRAAVRSERVPAGAAHAQVASSLGLPTPNASTLEVWGFRGMREVDGRPREQWTDEERQFFQDEKKEQPLMWAGHVGISFDGGTTIYGMTPDTRDPLTGVHPP